SGSADVRRARSCAWRDRRAALSREPALAHLRRRDRSPEADRRARTSQGAAGVIVVRTRCARIESSSRGARARDAALPSRLAPYVLWIAASAFGLLAMTIGG